MAMMVLVFMTMNIMSMGMEDGGYQYEDPFYDQYEYAPDCNGAQWVSDRGATSHMTNHMVVLGNPVAYSGGDSVIVGNGDSLILYPLFALVIPKL